MKSVATVFIFQSHCRGKIFIHRPCFFSIRKIRICFETLKDQKKNVLAASPFFGKFYLDPHRSYFRDGPGNFCQILHFPVFLSKKTYSMPAELNYSSM